MDSSILRCPLLPSSAGSASRTRSGPERCPAANSSIWCRQSITGPTSGQPARIHLGQPARQQQPAVIGGSSRQEQSSPGQAFQPGVESYRSGLARACPVIYAGSQCRQAQHRSKPLKKVTARKATVSHASDDYTDWQTAAERAVKKVELLDMADAGRKEQLASQRKAEDAVMR